MDRTRKLYSKALRKYENGYIEEAINICEEVLSLDINNRACINLKGLLYYFEGDLSSASSLWKLNYELNGDKVSKKYLEDIKEDENRFSAFISAMELIKEGKYQKAEDLLKECKNSDYNCINVNNALAECCIQLGKYEEAVYYVNSTLKLDRNNENAVKARKKLIKLGISKNRFENTSSKKPYMIIFLVFLFIALLFALKVQFKNTSNISEEIDNKPRLDTATSKTVAPKNEKSNANNEKSNANNEKERQAQKPIFPYKEVEKSFNEKNYEKLHEYVSKWNGKDLSINEKSLLAKGEETLKKDGVAYFYDKGREWLGSSDGMDKAISYFSIAYVYSENSYLHQHILYQLGSAYENKGNIEKSIAFYTEYINKFPNGNYSDEVLYRLVILYKNVDINKAKLYGQRLVQDYPNSQYDNSIVKSIINQ